VKKLISSHAPGIVGLLKPYLNFGSVIILDSDIYYDLFLYGIPKRVEENLSAKLEDIVRSRYWGGGVARSGPWEAEFEGRFARYHGCKYGICVSNGTVALHVALLAADIGPEDEVIVPDLTFWATGSAVLMTGATPIVVDVDPETCCLDVCKAEEAVTDKTKAIIPVYNYGTAPDMDRLVKLAKDHGLIMIEDCARGHGFMWGDKLAGSIGDMGCFSFQQGKFMTAGEGGIIITNSKMYEERCHSIKDCGRVREGYKYSGEC
jgi:dTDP-4-amino-4,6-dideoxygalactose transaminase